MFDLLSAKSLDKESVELIRPNEIIIAEKDDEKGKIGRASCRERVSWYL